MRKPDFEVTLYPMSATKPSELRGVLQRRNHQFRNSEGQTGTPRVPEQRKLRVVLTRSSIVLALATAGGAETALRSAQGREKIVSNKKRAMRVTHLVRPVAQSHRSDLAVCDAAQGTSLRNAFYFR